jgi:hypothetical protein
VSRTLTLKASSLKKAMIAQISFSSFASKKDIVLPPKKSVFG